MKEDRPKVSHCRCVLYFCCGALRKVAIQTDIFLIEVPRTRRRLCLFQKKIQGLLKTTLSPSKRNFLFKVIYRIGRADKNSLKAYWAQYHEVVKQKTPLDKFLCSAKIVWGSSHNINNVNLILACYLFLLSNTYMYVAL